MIDVQLAVAIVFLALTAWRESSGEPSLAKAAVICSILNRVDRPKWWGRSVLSVVVKKWQYSAMTAPGDPNLVRWPADNDPSWKECLALAQQAIEGHLPNPVPGADSYYDVSIEAPDWTAGARFVRQIARIRFYDVDHDYEAAAGAVTGVPA